MDLSSPDCCRTGTPTPAPCDIHWMCELLMKAAGLLNSIYLTSPHRFGRKPVLFATIALQTVFNFILVYSTSWLMLTILLFVNGLGQVSNFVAALVLGKYALLICRHTLFKIYNERVNNLVHFYFRVRHTSKWLCFCLPACRSWDLDWQRASPLLISGHVFRFHCWLHDPAALRLLV